MDVFKPLITTDNELRTILAKSTLSETDVYKLSSITPYTLVEKLGELKREELNEVYILEVKNIYAVLNTVYMLFGKIPSANQLIDDLIDTPYVQKLMQECDGLDTSIMSEEAWKFAMLSRFLLSDCDPQARLKAKFNGKIPTKMFSFRQTSAEEWYNEYINFVLSRTFIVMDKADEELAVTYLLRNICYYLNKSQTFKYHKKSSDKNDNDMFYRLLLEFADAVGGNNAVIKNTLTTTLFKDL